MTIYDEIAASTKRYEQGIANFLVDMIRIPSFSGKEKAVIDLVRKKMESMGFDEVIIDGLGNVLGRIGNGPRVMAFDAHVDTVYPGDLSLWQFDPFDGHIQDGKVWGRGAVDQKGGMASMIYAAKIIQELHLNTQYTLYFTGTVMEEDCDGLCWQYIINEAKIKPELVIITEPTNLNIYRGHRGRVEMTVEVKGLSCHGSAPERGDNAIYKMARIALALEKLNERLATDPFLGKGTLAVSQIASSSPSQCAVADQASLYIDRRLTQGETRESAVEEVREVCRLAGYPDVKIEVPVYEEKAYTDIVYPTDKYYPTWTLDEHSSWLMEAVIAYEKVLKRKPIVDKWTFSTNGVAIAGVHGIPCIGMGPGHEIYAHAPNEACPVEHLSQAAAFYAALIATLNRGNG